MKTTFAQSKNKAFNESRFDDTARETFCSLDLWNEVNRRLYVAGYTPLLAHQRSPAQLADALIKTRNLWIRGDDWNVQDSDMDPPEVKSGEDPVIYSAAGSKSLTEYVVLAGESIVTQLKIAHAPGTTLSFSMHTEYSDSNLFTIDPDGTLRFLVEPTPHPTTWYVLGFTVTDSAGGEFATTAMVQVLDYPTHYWVFKQISWEGIEEHRLIDSVYYWVTKDYDKITCRDIRKVVDRMKCTHTRIGPGNPLLGQSLRHKTAVATYIQKIFSDGDILTALLRMLNNAWDLGIDTAPYGMTGADTLSFATYAENYLGMGIRGFSATEGINIPVRRGTPYLSQIYSPEGFPTGDIFAYFFDYLGVEFHGNVQGYPLPPIDPPWVYSLIAGSGEVPNNWMRATAARALANRDVDYENSDLDDSNIPLGVPDPITSLLPYYFQGGELSFWIDACNLTVGPNSWIVFGFIAERYNEVSYTFTGWRDITWTEKVWREDVHSEEGILKDSDGNTLTTEEAKRDIDLTLYNPQLRSLHRTRTWTNDYFYTFEYPIFSYLYHDVINEHETDPYYDPNHPLWGYLYYLAAAPTVNIIDEYEIADVPMNFDPSEVTGIYQHDLIPSNFAGLGPYKPWTAFPIRLGARRESAEYFFPYVRYTFE